MEMLRAPKYIAYSSDGGIASMCCKVCGMIIYDAQRKHRNNYAELKMKFLDGSNAFHVTNLCRKCAPIVAKSKELMLACFNADLDDMVREIPTLEALRTQSKPRAVTIQLDARGIP